MAKTFYSDLHLIRKMTNPLMNGSLNSLTSIWNHSNPE